jgi:hypothetical protein
MPRGGVSAVAFGTTASGHLLLATASKNRKVRLWDPISKLNVATLRRRCNTRAIAIAALLQAIGDDEGLSVRLALFYLLSIRSWLWDGVPLCQGRTWPNWTSSP